MHPVLLKIGPITIYSYGVAIACAFLISTWLAGRRARDTGIEPGRIFDFAVWLLLSGIAGARLLYVILHPGEFAGRPLRIFNLSHPGLAIFGGIVFGLLGGVLFLRINRLPVTRVLDLVSPYVAFGQSIGRIGCLLYGCCYGRPSSLPIAIRFPGGGQPVHPVQIYESLACLLLFLFLRWRQERTRISGRIFLEYLFLYSLVRFFTEFFRGDNPPFWLHLSLFQLMGIVIMIVSSASIVVLERRHGRI